MLKYVLLSRKVYSTIEKMGLIYFTVPTTNQPLITSTGYLINQNEFFNALLTNNYPQPSPTQYTNLVTQAGPKGGIFSKLELAMFLAQIMWESDGLRAVREYYCYPNFNAGCEYSSGIGFPGVYYFGRGYIQLVSLENNKIFLFYFAQLFLT